MDGHTNSCTPNNRQPEKLMGKFYSDAVKKNLNFHSINIKAFTCNLGLIVLYTYNFFGFRDYSVITAQV